MSEQKPKIVSAVKRTGRLRTEEVPGSDPAHGVCALVEVLERRGVHHREPALQFCQLFARERLSQ